MAHGTPACCPPSPWLGRVPMQAAGNVEGLWVQAWDVSPCGDVDCPALPSPTATQEASML